MKILACNKINPVQCTTTAKKSKKAYHVVMKYKNYMGYELKLIPQVYRVKTNTRDRVESCNKYRRQLHSTTPTLVY